MNSITEKVTSRSGLSKAILVIRKKIVCFKEGKEFFNHNALHCFRDECSNCSGTIVEWIRFVTFREDLGWFLGGRKCTKKVDKMKNKEIEMHIESVSTYYQIKHHRLLIFL